MSDATDSQTLPALLDAVAARCPASEAFVSPRRRATYAELRDDSVAIGVGSAGEICVRGPSLFSHYDGLSPCDCFDAHGYFHTRDLGRLDERGALHFLGRIKDVIKTAGANVAAAEVEAMLLRHPAVGAAHVVPVPAGPRGEDVAAFVVASRPVEPAALLEHCRAELASYKVPRHLWLCREDELPLRGSGKVDKASLRGEAARLAGAR